MVTAGNFCVQLRYRFRKVCSLLISIVFAMMKICCPFSPAQAPNSHLQVDRLWWKKKWSIQYICRSFYFTTIFLSFLIDFLLFYPWFCVSWLLETNEEKKENISMLLWCCAVENVLQVPFVVDFTRCFRSMRIEWVFLYYYFNFHLFRIHILFFFRLLFSHRSINNVVSFVFILFKIEKKSAHTNSTSFILLFPCIFS